MCWKEPFHGCAWTNGRVARKVTKVRCFFLFWHPVWLDLLDNVTHTVILYIFMSLNIPV